MCSSDLPHAGQGIPFPQLAADDKRLDLLGDLLVNGFSTLVADDNVQTNTSFPGARAPCPRASPRAAAIPLRV